jgi:hypothetical protein
MRQRGSSQKRRSWARSGTTTHVRCPTRSAGQLAALRNLPGRTDYNSPDCTVCTTHVRCAIQPMALSQRIDQRHDQHRTRQCHVRRKRVGRGHRTCLVRAQTKGDQSLPNGGATDPCPLGAIKEAPRRLYPNTKHSRAHYNSETPQPCLRSV